MSDDTTTTTSSVVVGLSVAAGVMTCGLLVCSFVFCRNDRRTKPPASIISDQEGSGSSGDDISPVRGWKKQRDEEGEEYAFHDVEGDERSGEMIPGPDSDLIIEEEEQEDEEALFEEGRRALEQAETFFPGIFPDIGLSEDDLHRYRTMLGRYVAESPAAIVRTEVTDHISRKLRDLDDSSRERLMKRENAKELCLLLGMNPVLVDLKFLATEAFEKKFNFDFKKCRIVNSIFHLISQFGVSNPFGKVTKDNRIEDYEERKGHLFRLRYFGVRAVASSYTAKTSSHATPNGFVPLIDSINNVLSQHDLDDFYMHGTTATNLQNIVNDGSVGISSGKKKHDFGPGLYCFKGKMEGALMYAFDRSWPKNKTQDNPSVVLFNTENYPPIDESDIFHVGHTPYPTNELQKTARRNDEVEKYDKMVKNQKSWSKTDWQWKQFVKASLYLGFVPRHKELFYGLIHDSDQLGSTGNCREPQPDSDRWIQYCFPDPEVLGRNLIFIELHIDWREWLPTQVSSEFSSSCRKHTIDLLTRLANGETFEEKDLKFPKPVKEIGKKKMGKNTPKEQKSSRGR